MGLRFQIIDEVRGVMLLDHSREAGCPLDRLSDRMDYPSLYQSSKTNSSIPATSKRSRNTSSSTNPFKPASEVHVVDIDKSPDSTASTSDSWDDDGIDDETLRLYKEK